MKSLIFALGTLILLVSGAEFKGKIWVLLVAGSHTYTNYRHQADICHAYQIFHKNGIPDEQIVVMMYDDIANNPSNPKKGSIINRPGGSNVYQGVPKDYTGNEVTTDTFYAALQGKKDRVKVLTGRDNKVIDSGPDDHIFVFYVDHGGVGIIGMPSARNILANYLSTVLTDMHREKRFAKLVFYVEACYAGSIFHGLLPKNINVYATTAANYNEVSYACYCDQHGENCLGDIFSVNWMEDTENANLQTRTLQQQYITVKEKMVKDSTVMQYGDLSIANLTLDQFFGNGKSDSENDPASGSKDSTSDAENDLSPTKKDTIHNAMVRVQLLIKRIQATPLNSAKRSNLKKELNFVYQEMKQTHDLFNNIARSVHTNLPDNLVYDLAFRKRSSIKHWDCYEAAVDTLTDFCPGIDGNNEVGFRKLYVLVNLCNSHKKEKVVSAIESAITVSPICWKDTS